MRGPAGGRARAEVAGTHAPRSGRDSLAGARQTAHPFGRGSCARRRRDGVRVRRPSRGLAERGIRALRRPAIWIPLSIAASLRSHSSPFVRWGSSRRRRHRRLIARADPEFDTVVAYFEKFDHRFDPNVPSDAFRRHRRRILERAHAGLHLELPQCRADPGRRSPR